MANLLQIPAHGSLLLVDPHGLVFLAPGQDWQYKVLWQDADFDPEEARRTRQFGQGPWENLGFRRLGNNRALGSNGRKYLCYELSLGNPPGWHVVYLRDYVEVLNSLAHPTMRKAGLTFSLFMVLMGGVIALLYRSASQDLRQRKMAEQALADSEGRFRSIVEHSHDGIVIIDGNFCLVYVNQEYCRITNYSGGRAPGPGLPTVPGRREPGHGRWKITCGGGGASPPHPGTNSTWCARTEGKGGWKPIPRCFDHTLRRVANRGPNAGHNRTQAGRGSTCGKARKNTAPSLKTWKKGILS